MIASEITPSTLLNLKRIIMKHFEIPAMLAVLAATLCTATSVLAADDPYLKDRIAIQDLLARNIQANDSKKMDELMATYSKKNPELHTNEQDCIGLEAVTAFNKSMNCRNVPGGSAVPGTAAAPGAPGGAPGGAAAAPGTPGGAGGGVNPRVAGMQHITCCSVVDFTDKNNAAHRGYYYTVMNGNIISVGHYEDVLVREDGRWVIKSRRLAH
jgi:hypothetical protein